VAVSASAGTKVFTTTNNEGKVTFHVTTSATLPSATPAAPATVVGAQPTTPKKTVNVGRGMPPPVPPNKPIIPPKKSSTSTMSSSSGAVVSAPINSQLTGQTPSPLPVVISCSNNPQVTTVERGRPISLELVQPVPKAGQVASQQGVTSIGITITKDKIQISSNPPPPTHPTATAPQSPRPMNDEAVQVGDGLDCDIGRSWWAPEPEHAEPTILLARTPPSPLSSPLSLALSDFEVLLNRELDDFQQLLDSMDSSASNSPLPPSPSQFSLTSSSSSSSSWLDSSLLSSGSSEDQRKEIMSHSNSLLLSCCCPAIIHHRFLLVCYYLSLNLESLVITAIRIPLIRRFDVVGLRRTPSKNVWLRKSRVSSMKQWFLGRRIWNANSL